MKKTIFCGLAAFALAFALTSPAGADLAPYSQDFEGLDQQDPGALTGDGWLIFGNAWDANWNYLFGYGVFGAPNGGPGFSGIDLGQGGPDQGDQQLVIYNDYNNGVHGFGGFVEANVFQEQIIGAADVGGTWRFSFDGKRGNIAGGSTASAFFKVLNPAAGFSLSRFITVDTTNLAPDWAAYSLEIEITADLVGQILQFGYLTVATNYEGSGNFYDNINFDLAPLAVTFDVRPDSCPNPINSFSQGLLPTAIMGSADLDVNDIDVSSLRLEGSAEVVNFSYEDAGTAFDGPMCGCAGVSLDGITDLKVKFRTQDVIDALGGAIGPGDYALSVSGTLLDGTVFEGVDCVFSVGGNRPAPAKSSIERRQKRSSDRGGSDIQLRSIGEN